MDREAIEEAIEVLEDANADMLMETGDKNYYVEAIAVLRQALVELEQKSDPSAWHGWVLREVLFDNGEPIGHREPEQKPVAWMFVNEDGECEQIEYGPVFDDPDVTPLYTAPPKKQWVSLTDQEVWEAIDDVLEGGGWLDVARVLEQAFKEKNT